MALMKWVYVADWLYVAKYVCVADLKCKDTKGSTHFLADCFTIVFLRNTYTWPEIHSTFLSQFLNFQIIKKVISFSLPDLSTQLNI